MSIGGNDAGFGQVLAGLLEADPEHSGPLYQQKLTEIFNAATARLTDLRNTRFPNLAIEIAPLQAKQVFLTEYPDLTKDSTGNFAQKVLDDIKSGFEIDQYELERAFNQVAVPVVGALRDACRKFEWTYVQGVAEAYQTHGYGDWLRKAVDSAVNQGPIGNKFFPSEDDLKTTKGTMHPIAGGLTAIKDRITQTLDLPYFAVGFFSISPDAFVGNGAESTFTVGVHNTSFKTTAPASVVKIYISRDPIVTTDDIEVATINLPSIGPDTVHQITGTLPHIGDPFLTFNNEFYVAPVLDVGGAVTESNEVDNTMADRNKIKDVQSDRDWAASAPPLTMLGKNVQVNSMTSAFLGSDEPIGDCDIDVYRFAAAAGQRLGFDIDAAGSLDTYVRVYRVVDNQIVDPFNPLAQNDDALAPGEGPGQHNPKSSYLSHVFLQGGEYVLLVGHALNAGSHPMIISDRAHAFQEGPYEVTISEQDSVAPTLLSASFSVNQNLLAYEFSEDVSPSFILSTVLTLQNVTTGQIVPTSATYWTSSNTALFTFPFSTGLPAGNYRAFLPGAAIIDRSGNAMFGNHMLEFFALPGDANRDRAVNINDFATLASKFNQNGTFTQGDFNYSGRVDIGDFSILASSFNRTLPPLGGGGQLADQSRPLFVGGGPFSKGAFDPSIWKQMEIM
jgi:hypothetical protein